MPLTAPRPFGEHHNIESFRCGEPVLDTWLEEYARKNEAHGASRTYVIAMKNDVVVYYSLVVSNIGQTFAPGIVRRNMPVSLPVMLLGRLAVNAQHQGHGLRGALLRDAILRTVQASTIAGIRALLVHALHDRALRFYASYGFIPSPINALT